MGLMFRMHLIFQPAAEHFPKQDADQHGKRKWGCLRKSAIRFSTGAQTMTDDAIVTLEWTYNPPDFFEQPVPIEDLPCKVVIENGKVLASMNEDVYENNPELCKRIDERLQRMFQGAQLVSQKPYSLTKADMTRLLPGGHKLTTKHLEGQIRLSGTLDIIRTDANGNVITDTRQERIDREQELANLVARIGDIDKIATSILVSFRAAIQDHNNELVHLYEVRDALDNRFGGQKNMRKELGISDMEYKRLGQLANDCPFNQGRHRGEYAGQSRDATEAELAEARDITVDMILAYLKYVTKERNL
jgi:hypothetical protein